MRLLVLATLATTITLRAQPAERPAWLDVFDKARPAPGQGYVPLGVYDAEVEGAWTAALAAGPDHPYFISAAQQSANYFTGQGYAGKGEAILRQALAVSPLSASLVSSLSTQLQQQQRLIAAAAVLQDFLAQSKEVTHRASCLRQLASLREQIGDLDSVEPLLREANSLPSGPYERVSGSGISVPELTQFHLRQGDTAKGEALFKQALSDSKTPTALFRATHSYAFFLMSQQRADEAAKLWETLLNTLSTQAQNKPLLPGIRDRLAEALTVAGQHEKSLALARESLAAAPTGSIERLRAIERYAQLLIQQKKFEDAEMAVEQLRQPPSGATLAMAMQHDQLADRLLARVRTEQGRLDEARALLKNSHPPQDQGPVAAPDSARISTRLRPFHGLTRLGKYDEAIQLLTQVLADSGPRIQANLGEFDDLAVAIFELPDGRSNEIGKLTAAALELLDAVRPAGHPRVAEALTFLANRMVSSGLASAQTSQTLDWLESSIASSKGQESPALNEVSLLRAQHYIKRGNHAEAGMEIKKALARVETAAGPKSQPTLLYLRHAITALQSSNENWAQEEALRLRLIAGDKQTTLGDLRTLAIRYAAVGQRDNAVLWIDRAIEVAKKNPQFANHLTDLQETRAKFANLQ